jgi:hypothetical protein
MFLRTVKWIPALLLAAAAFVATPSRSQAAIEVLIQEIGPGGPVTIYNNTVPTNGQVSISSSSYASINLGFQNLSFGTTSSFSTQIGVTPVAGLDLSTAPMLSIIAQDTGPNGTGLLGVQGASASLINAVSVTVGGGTGIETITGTTRVVDFPSNSFIGESGSNQATSPFGSDGSITPISNLASAYSLIQSFTVSFSGQGDLGANSATISSGLTSVQPVPAPPAVLLGALALPIFGMRRYLKRKTA